MVRDAEVSLNRSSDIAYEQAVVFDGMPAPGATLGLYVIERRLGQGGVAAVLSARHKTLATRVAIKMLLPRCAAYVDIARQFMHDGEAIARLSHAHVVDVSEVAVDRRGTPYLVTEFLEGEDLGRLLRSERTMSVQRVADLLVPVVSALLCAHEAGVLHRNLKPQNVFFARVGDSVVPKVLDFGMSGSVESEQATLGEDGAPLGAPHYFSPEQTRGAELDARTDQFSLGVLLYECVAGRRPFEDGSAESVMASIRSARPTPLHKLVRSLDPRFEALVNRALQKQPAKRFADMRELGRELVQCASVRTRLSYGHEFGLVSMRPSQQPPAGVRPELRRAALLGATLGAVLVVALLSAILPGLLKPHSVASVAAASAKVMPPSGSAVPAKAAPARPPQVASTALPQRAAVGATTRSAAATYEVRVHVKPHSAHLKLDGVRVATGQFELTLPVDGVEHVIEASKRGFRTKLARFRDAPPEVEWTLERSARTTVAPSLGRRERDGGLPPVELVYPRSRKPTSKAASSPRGRTTPAHAPSSDRATGGSAAKRRAVVQGASKSSSFRTP